MNEVIYCQDAKDLLVAFGLCIQEVLRLHEEQFQAVIAGDSDSARFDDLIHVANQQKLAAKYRYLRHLETHGCSTWDRSKHQQSCVR